MAVDFAWMQPDFSPAGVALGLVLVAYLVLIEPVSGFAATHTCADIAPSGPAP